MLQVNLLTTKRSNKYVIVTTTIKTTTKYGIDIVDTPKRTIFYNLENEVNSEVNDCKQTSKSPHLNLPHL